MHSQKLGQKRAITEISRPLSARQWEIVVKEFAFSKQLIPGRIAEDLTQKNFIIACIRKLLLGRLLSDFRYLKPV